MPVEYDNLQLYIFAEYTKVGSYTVYSSFIQVTTPDRHIGTYDYLFHWIRQKTRMKAARRYSTLFSQMNTSSRGTPAPRKALSAVEAEGTRLCHTSVVEAKAVKGTSQQLKCTSSTSSGGPAGTVTSIHEHQRDHELIPTFTLCVFLV